MRSETNRKNNDSFRDGIIVVVVGVITGHGLTLTDQKFLICLLLHLVK